VSGSDKDTTTVVKIVMMKKFYGTGLANWVRVKQVFQDQFNQNMKVKI